MGRQISLLLFGFVFSFVAFAQDELYILIKQPRAFACNGVRNEIDISERDIQLEDGNGNRVHYLKAPGEYVLNFRRIQVHDDLPNLSGELSTTLKIPLGGGGGGFNFHLPYQVIPQQRAFGLLGMTCDRQSGVVDRNGRAFCRYCDLCWTAKQVEEGLTQRYQNYLPKVASGEEASFQPYCNRIGPRSYQLKRTVRLPTKSELRRQAEQNYRGKLEQSVANRLRMAEGVFNVFLNLISSNQDPLRIQQFYARDPECRCCGQQQQGGGRRGAGGVIGGILGSFLGGRGGGGGQCGFGSCNRERCYKKYTENCLQGRNQLSACYIVEFNYELTDNFAEVQQHLRRLGVSEQSPATRRRGSRGQPPATSRGRQPDQRTKQRCLQRMRLRYPAWFNYCRGNWDPARCCTACRGIC